MLHTCILLTGGGQPSMVPCDAEVLKLRMRPIETLSVAS